MSKSKLLLLAAIGAFSLAIAPASEARSRYYHHDDRHHYGHYHHGRSRTVYVIENRRPVRRVVYVDNGRYYRIVSGRRVYVTGRCFTSYPSHYYYSDGRPRVGVSIRF
jgi:hypothetical protein